MKRSMLDILACPIDKNHPLELSEINAKNEIVYEGTLFCSRCSRFFPIIEEIPIMLPDELRDKKQEMDFLKRFKDRLPEKIVTGATPWHL